MNVQYAVVFRILIWVGIVACAPNVVNLACSRITSLGDEKVRDGRRLDTKLSVVQMIESISLKKIWPKATQFLLRHFC